MMQIARTKKASFNDGSQKWQDSAKSARYLVAWRFDLLPAMIEDFAQVAQVIDNIQSCILKRGWVDGGCTDHIPELPPPSDTHV
jgi:hypothetical protein